MELIERLAEIQISLNAPKSQKNTFGNYSYRSCEDILTAVKPLLKGLIVVITDEIIMIGDRYYIKATARIEGKENSFIEACGWARESVSKKGMDDSQLTGSTSSYARKYALNGLFCIDDSKDADTDELKTQADNTPNWYNDFESQKEQMLAKILSGEQTVDGIINSLKKAGYKLSKKTEQLIKDLK